MSEEQYPRVYLYRRLVQAKLFIDDHYAEQIDLDNISDEAYFSKFHFIRLFKKIYGRTPHQYQVYLRIEKAKELLKADHAVSETCYAVGFESLGSFSGLFKRITGSTPSAFLTHQQQMKAELNRSPLSFIPGCFAARNGWLEK